MKKLIVLSLSFCFSLVWGQQSISTVRIGDIRINDSVQSIEKKLGIKLKMKAPTEEYGLHTAMVMQYDAPVKLSFYKSDYENKISYSLSSISTKSAALKTVSGMGVGNTYEELFNTYKDKDFESFTDYENKKLRYFVINDNDEKNGLYTSLTFTIENDIVIEVSIAYGGDGC